jgi:hypothetical protein
VAGSYLDTTVVIHIAEGIQPGKSKGEAFVSVNQPAETPYYALQELLAGRIRILCETHNALRAAQNIGEAMLALLARSPAEGRKKESRLQAVAVSLAQAFDARPSGAREDIKREMLQDLAVKTSRLWSKARRLNAVRTVQPLACFNDGKISFGEAGELRGPNDSFNCIKSVRCAAAAYIFDDRISLKKMIAALHPQCLEPRIAGKNESKQRRKALKELQVKGPVDFSKVRCRALGDAYFAAMCPPGSVVVTTNMEDYEPLCSALGKVAKKP